MTEEQLLKLKETLERFDKKLISGIVLNFNDFLDIKILNKDLKIFDIKINWTEGHYYLDGILLLHSKLVEQGKFYFKLYDD